MAKSNRTLEPALPQGNVPINTSKTPATGGKHIRKNTSVAPVTPNPHVAELHTPAVGVRNTPTKGKK